MVENERDIVLQELASETLNDTELHEILEFITHKEFSGDKPTLGSLAEATGHSVASLAHELARIRNDHDPRLLERIERLENQVSEHAIQLSFSPSAPLVVEKPKLKFVGSYLRTQRDSPFAEQVTLAIGVVIVLIILLGLLAVPTQRSETSCVTSDGTSFPCTLPPR